MLTQTLGMLFVDIYQKFEEAYLEVDKMVRR